METEPTPRMLSMVGMSHHNAPLEVRECFALAADEVEAMRQQIVERFRAGALIVTCNRMELYVPGAADPAALRGFLANAVGVGEDVGERYLLARQDTEAVRHLYGVAAGIDSMVLGETEILGQVRSAFSGAVTAGADNAFLSRLFHTAIRVGRRARTETKIGRNALSISSIAVKQARALVPGLGEATVLVIGAGEAGRLAAAALRDGGVGQIVVTNRTLEHAEALADELGGRAVPLAQLADALASADVVIAATGSSEPVLRANLVESATRGRRQRPLLVIDIGVPRAAEPGLAMTEGVTYCDIDDLQSIAAENAAARAAEVSRVQTIVDEATDDFLDWWRHLEVVPTITALTERAERLRQQEMEKALRRMKPSDAEREQLEALTKGLVRQLLHDPIITLRTSEDREAAISAARRLFCLDTTSESAAGRS